jgi:hypothetical protein
MKLIPEQVEKVGIKRSYRIQVRYTTRRSQHAAKSEGSVERKGSERKRGVFSSWILVS